MLWLCLEVSEPTSNHYRFVEILPPITYLWSENVRDTLYKACDNEGNESLKGFSVSRYNVMPIADDNCYWKDASAYPKNTAPHRHCFSMSASADQISMLILFIVSMFAIERKWSSANSIQLSYLLALDKWIYSAPSYSFGFDISGLSDKSTSNVSRMIEHFSKTLWNNSKFFVYDEGTKMGKNSMFLKTTSRYIINR